MLVAYTIYSAFAISEHRAGRFELLKRLFTKEGWTGKHILMLIGTGLIVAASSFLTIYSIQELSSLTKILPSVFGVSLLAIGTSLPELTVIFAALKKGQNQIAIGTVIGSCIFNATLVMAIPALISPLNISLDTLTIGIPFLLISVLLFIFATLREKLYWFDGGIFAILYLTFLGQFFNIF
jgi:cation:H+ antiporter